MLFLSFCMPPLKYPRSIQISRLIKNMPFKPSVIYGDEKNNLDYTILANFDDFIKYKYQIPFKIDNRYFSFFKRKCFPLLYKTPDINKSWSKKLYSKASSYLKNNDENTIVTFGQPMSVHLAGLKLKKDNPHLKWIAHFSDPWVDNPLDKKGFFVKKININLEKNVFELADKLIFTSNETIELVGKKYNSDINDKMYYLPHSYDDSLYNYSLENKNGTFIIRYIGGFYSQRSPKPLFEAVLNILKNEKNILNDVKFEIIGNLGRHKKILNNYNNIAQYFTFIENVSYQKSLDIMLSSDVLLVIDAPSKKSIFFPSKLVDYIGSKKPIIGITPDGTSKNIIQELNGLTANPDNIEDISQMISKVLKNKMAYRNFICNNHYIQFNAKNVTNKFMDIIKNV